MGRWQLHKFPAHVDVKNAKCWASAGGARCLKNPSYGYLSTGSTGTMVVATACARHALPNMVSVFSRQPRLDCSAVEGAGAGAVAVPRTHLQRLLPNTNDTSTISIQKTPFDGARRASGGAGTHHRGVGSRCNSCNKTGGGDAAYEVPLYPTPHITQPPHVSHDVMVKENELLKGEVKQGHAWKANSRIPQSRTQGRRKSSRVERRAGGKEVVCVGRTPTRSKTRRVGVLMPRSSTSGCNSCNRGACHQDTIYTTAATTTTPPLTDGCAFRLSTSLS